VELEMKRLTWQLSCGFWKRRRYGCHWRRNKI